MQRSLLLVVLLLPVSAFAQGIWGQRGATRAFAVNSSGSILYTADGRGVSAYDVRGNSVTRIDTEWGDDETYDLALMGASDLVVATSTGVERFAVRAGGTLERLSWIGGPGRVSHVAANARYAAAAAGSVLTVLERDGEELHAARRLTLPAAITALEFVGDYLYVASEEQPLRVYLPPAAATVKILPSVDASDMAVASNTLWAVSENDALVGIDVTDPTNPSVIASAGLNELRLRGVAAAGSRLFAFEGTDRLHVFDVSNRAAPRLAETRTEWVNALAATGERLFLSGAIVTESGLAFNPGLIPRETGKPVRVFDAATLDLVTELDDLAGPVSGVWTDGSVAYVIDPPYLRVLDVSKTSEPREVYAMTVPNLQDKIRVKNGRAVIYGRAFVNYLDVTTPLRPRYLGTWDVQGHPPSVAAILRDRVIEANEHSGMHVIDFSDPNRPVQIGGRIWHYVDIAASDDAAYALQAEIMVVVEIENERRVVDRGHVGVRHDQVDTSPPNASQPPLLLSRGGEGLRLYSIAGEERFAPRLLEFFPMTGLDQFATGDGLAYIARDGRLHFIDLTRNIALQETEWRVTSPMQMSVAGGKIVVADRYQVRVYGPDTAPPPPLPTKRRSVRQ
ncbi:MAG TPA: hypothetical protein VEO54_28005 [Thermoanaerobaculia bacterium]|nr:hypothetical protein [Thermoanaerobaculia bacterium]